jgi:hypothetical protein
MFIINNAIVLFHAFRFGIGLDEILVFLIVDLDHFITHESHVKNIDLIRGQITQVGFHVNQFHFGHVGTLLKFSLGQNLL